MKTRTKKLLGVVGIVATLGILTSCNSFCSSYDSASFRYQHDPINTRFFDSAENAKKYAFETFQKDHKKQKDVLLLDKDGQTSLTADNIDQLKVSVFDETGKKVEKSIIAPASEVFTFEGTSTVVSSINSKLNETYVIRSGVATAFYAVETKKDDKTEIVYSPLYTTYSKNGYVQKIEETAKKQFLPTPVNQYWSDLDEKVISEMIKKAEEAKYFDQFKANGELEGKVDSLFELFYGFSNAAYNDYLAKPTESKENLLKKGGLYKIEGQSEAEYQIGRNNSLFTLFGYSKYVSDETSNAVEASQGKYWEKIENWNEQIRLEHLEAGSGYTMPNDFFTLYKGNMDQQAAALRTCITIDDGYYGHYGDDPLNNTIKLSNKSSWRDAWKHGFLEGLFVYPIAYMVEYFAHAFGMNGWGQIGAVLLVTIIVRGLFMLVTFKSTLSQQRMQTLQPEIAKLQQKYPNSDTNQYEKQRLAQAQMALYKKYKIHPFSSLLIVIIQFPVFISVWNGFSGAASLTTDAVLGLRLSNTIWNSLTNFTNWPAWGGWWTALVLILLMSAGQIVSMQVPRWLQKKQMKEISRTHKNPAESSQQKQMKWVSWFMTAFIIIMGFTLPAAMGVYWFAGALFSMIQTTIMHYMSISKGHKKEKKVAFAGAKTKKTVEPEPTTESSEGEVIDFTTKENKENQNKKPHNKKYKAKSKHNRR